MVGKIEVTVTDLKKRGKAGYKNLYSIAKHVYMDNEEVYTIGLQLIKKISILKSNIDTC